MDLLLAVHLRPVKVHHLQLLVDRRPVDRQVAHLADLPEVHHLEAHHQAHPEPPPEVHPAEQALPLAVLHPEVLPQQLPVQALPWAPLLVPLPAVLALAQLVAAVPPEVHQAAQVP